MFNIFEYACFRNVVIISHETTFDIAMPKLDKSESDFLDEYFFHYSYHLCLIELASCD